MMRDLHNELMGLPRRVIIVDKHWWFFYKPGSILIGKVMGYVYDKKTGERNYLVVQREKGKKLILVSLFGSRLREQLDRLGVREGDRIEIKYLGRDPETSLWTFNVIVDFEARMWACGGRRGKGRKGRTR